MNDKTNATDETIDTRTQSCNRGTALERVSRKKNLGGFNQFYSSETALIILM